VNVLLLLPIGLAAFAALLLPLLVHLARRSEQRVVPFAALRWLRALPQPRRKHRLEEWLLLLLRLLLLAALALLFAQPVLFGRADDAPRVALAPGIAVEAARTAGAPADAHWLRLAPGFPEIRRDGEPADAARAPAAQATLPSLLRELDAQLPAGAPLTVVVPPTLTDADAQRPQLSRRVDWRVLSAPAAGPAAAAPRPLPTPRMQVRYAPARVDAVRYLRAAGVAWAVEDASAAGPPSADAAAPPSRVSIAPATQPLDPAAPRLAWLVPGPVPAHVQRWVRDGGEALLDADAQWPGFARDAAVAWRDDAGPLLRTQRHGRGRVLQWQRALLPAAVPALVEADFPQRLREALDGEPVAPARVAARDHAPRSGAPAWPEKPQPLAPWLAWLIALLFVLERWLASGPRRSEAA
jgi:hypothetical protein